MKKWTAATLMIIILTIGFPLGIEFLAFGTKAFLLPNLMGYALIGMSLAIILQLTKRGLRDDLKRE